MPRHLFFKSGPKLGNLLCKNNKTRSAKIDQKEFIRKLSCSCSPNASYVGETHVSIRTRMKQHRDVVHSYNPDSPNAVNVSGITKHAHQCTSGTVNWTEPEILSTFQGKEKA
jgi:hypothetical protein